MVAGPSRKIQYEIRLESHVLRMELRQLRYFTVLAEELNFTRAAQRLHISQPPLSAQIASLEADLGVQLFVRSSRRVALTPAGASFLRDARTVQGRLKEAVQRAQNIHAGLAGSVELGLSGSHFLGPLPELIGLLARRYPEVHIVLNEMEPNDQIEALREYRIDLSISRQSIEDEVLTSRSLWADPLWVALPAGHPLAACACLTIADLSQESFVMLRRESSTFAERIFRACSAHGFSPRVAQTVAQVPAQLSLVAASLGIALVPASARTPQAGAVTFVALDEPELEGSVHAVFRRDNGKAVLQTVVEQLAASAGSREVLHSSK